MDGIHRLAGISEVLKNLENPIISDDFLNIFEDFLNIFGAIKPPRSGPPEACPPPKVTPGRGLAARRFFLKKLIKINDFNVKIMIFKCFQYYLAPTTNSFDEQQPARQVNRHSAIIY